MRIFIKGGVWKNTEDEVLKLLVMKYGLNQWSRIASLLHRKSAKQCKARWFEWLDPSIKKTEWSREEEEKLLHLAKLMPTQWRTIAPIVGRTAAQCLEHYEKLIDAAQAATGEGSSTDGPRTLKPGEVDPHPESRPAKPDPIDMGEDEKEMLMEARARLANTQGKKAKRKAREKSLEEAHRLAMLQKRKELRAAGLETTKRKKKRKRGIDYNAEIPLEKRPAIGFYDTSNEDHEFQQVKRAKKFQAIDIRDLKPVDRDAEEAKARKKDAEKQAKRKAENLPDHVLKIQQQHNMGEAARDRTSLLLPKPQVSNEEIRDIVKLGQTSDAALSFVETGSSASKGLLQDYSLTQGLTPQRTAPAGGKKDSILMAAQNLVALNETQTPLAGGINTPLHETNFAVQSTPNTILGTPLNQAGIPGGMTPQRGGGKGAQATPGATPGATPLRDSLSINSGDATGDTPVQGRRERQRQNMLKRQLREGLLGLPAPQNDLELQLPDDYEGDEAEATADGRVLDQSDVDKARRNKNRMEEEAEMRLRSSVIRQSLPRPRMVTLAPVEVTADMSEIERADAAIQQQMVAMIQCDAFDFPVAGGQRPRQRATVGDVSESELSAAQALLEVEMEAMGVVPDQLQEPFVAAVEAERNASIFLNQENRLAWRVRTSEADMAKAGELTFQTLKKRMDESHKAAKKLEKKVERLTKGYQMRATAVTNDVQNRYVQVDHARRELACFQHLKLLEEQAIPARKEALEREVEALRRKEKDLQSQYALLVSSRNTVSAAPVMAN